MSESRVEVPLKFLCPTCGQEVPAPFRGRPAELIAGQLVLYCDRYCASGGPAS